MPEPFLAIKTRRLTESIDPITGSIISGQFKVSKTKPMTNAVSYFTSQIRRGGELLHELDGLYTWIIKQKRNQNTLFAARTRSQQELGTLHKNLDEFTPNEGAVIAAGEFQKSGSNIKFNLQSGSYMQTIFSKIKDSRDQEIVRDRIVTDVIKTFKDVGFINVEFNIYTGPINRDKEIAGTPMINTESIMTTPENFALYSQYLNFGPPKKGGGRRTRRKRHSTRVRSRRMHESR